MSVRVLFNFIFFKKGNGINFVMYHKGFNTGVEENAKEFRIYNF